MAASNVELTNFQRACVGEMVEVHKPVFLCKKNEESHNDDLLPFYHSNPELIDIYNLICDDSEDQERHKVP